MSDVDAINLVRIQETDAGLELMGKSINEWVDAREKKDARKQYGTLLKTLRLQLGVLVGEVRASFHNIHPSADRGTVYAACRLEEKRLLWIERLWDYFRDRFDQRDNPERRDVLAAADEVVWSCYEEPFRATGRPHGPAPLPYIAADYSPRAVTRTEIPQDLRSDVDSPFLKKMLAELPVPVVGLPPQCIREPWWLIFLAHEVGHHVQFDLLPQEELVNHFRGFIAASIPDSEAAERWRYRAEEVFADAWSLYMTGQWALWALTELEWTTGDAMVREGNVRYPSPAARLLLMSRILNLLGLDGVSALRGYPRSDSEDSGEHADVLSGIALKITSCPVAAGQTFAQLCDWSIADHTGSGAVVNDWKLHFLGSGGMMPEETLRAARLALAGGFAAWAEISTDTDRSRRLDRKQHLAQELVAAVRNSHEPVERAAEIEAAAAGAKSSGLISALFDSSPQELGAW